MRKALSCVCYGRTRHEAVRRFTQFAACVTALEPPAAQLGGSAAAHQCTDAVLRKADRDCSMLTWHRPRQACTQCGARCGWPRGACHERCTVRAGVSPERPAALERTTQLRAYRSSQRSDRKSAAVQLSYLGRMRPCPVPMPQSRRLKHGREVPVRRNMQHIQRAAHNTTYNRSAKRTQRARQRTWKRLSSAAAVATTLFDFTSASSDFSAAVPVLSIFASCTPAVPHGWGTATAHGAVVHACVRSHDGSGEGGHAKHRDRVRQL